MRRRLFLGIGAWCAGWACIAGCSSSSGYPEATVTKPVGTPGVCHHCGRAIERVAAEQVLDVGSAFYVVCSPECAGEMRTWHQNQIGK